MKSTPFHLFPESYSSNTIAIAVHGPSHRPTLAIVPPPSLIVVPEHPLPLTAPREPPPPCQKNDYGCQKKAHRSINLSNRPEKVDFWGIFFSIMTTLLFFSKTSSFIIDNITKNIWKTGRKTSKVILFCYLFCFFFNFKHVRIWNNLTSKL